MSDSENKGTQGRVYRFVRKPKKAEAIEEKKKDEIIDLLSGTQVGDKEEFSQLRKKIGNITLGKKSHRSIFGSHTEKSGQSDRDAVSENEDTTDDIDLLMIFGMEEQAKRQNPTKYGELKGNIEKHKIIKNRMEYISRSQNSEMKKKFGTEMKSCTLKLIISIVLLAVCAALEYYIFFEKSIVGRFLIYYNPSLVGLAALQMLLFISALSYRRFFRGFGFFAGRANINSFFTLTSLSLLIYYIFIIMTPSAVASDGSFTFNLFLTPFALMGLSGCIYDVIKCRCESETFSVICDDNEDSAIEKTAIESFGRRNANELFRSSNGNRALAVRKCDFVSSFVSRTRCGLRDRRFSYTLCLISMLFSVGIWIYKFFTSGHSYAEAFSYSTFSLFMTMPMSAYLTYSLIPGATVLSQAKKKSAIIGDKSFEEYSDACALYFDDNSIFKSSGIKLKGFDMYNNVNMDDSLYIIASVYTKIGSPAAGLFRDSVSEKISKDVDIIDVSKNGLHASVDGRSVYLGAADYIRGCGFGVDSSGDEKIPFQALYMAVDHKMAIRVYLEYKLDKNAANMVYSLKKQRKHLGVFTCDPCINEKMIEKEIGSEKYPVWIIRVNADNKADKLESGIVTLRGIDGLLNALSRCVRTCGIWKIDSGLRYFVTASGAFLSLLFAIFVDPGELGLVYALASLLLGCIPTILFSLFLRDK